MIKTRLFYDIALLQQSVDIKNLHISVEVIVWALPIFLRLESSYRPAVK